MLVTVQIVENPDRLHVSLDGVPVETFIYAEGWGSYEDKQAAQLAANDRAFKEVTRLSKEGFKFKVLPQAAK